MAAPLKTSLHPRVTCTFDTVPSTPITAESRHIKGFASSVVTLAGKTGGTADTIAGGTIPSTTA
jgi:hypothetical protein